MLKWLSNSFYTCDSAVKSTKNSTLLLGVTISQWNSTRFRFDSSLRLYNNCERCGFSRLVHQCYNQTKSIYINKPNLVFVCVLVNNVGFAVLTPRYDKSIVLSTTLPFDVVTRINGVCLCVFDGARDICLCGWMWWRQWHDNFL